MNCSSTGSVSVCTSQFSPSAESTWFTIRCLFTVVAMGAFPSVGKVAEADSRLSAAGRMRCRRSLGRLFRFSILTDRGSGGLWGLSPSLHRRLLRAQSFVDQPGHLETLLHSLIQDERQLRGKPRLQ